MEQKVLGIVSPVPMGNWASNTVYQNLNIVRHNGASYIAKSSNTNIEPGVTVGWGSYWMLLNDDGEIGPTGPQGIPGEGVPPGGLAGYVLSKNSNTNYDSKWLPQNELAAGSAEKDGQGNIIADTYVTNQDAQETYEKKSDATQKNTSLQDQITQNTQTISRNSKRLDGLEQRINPSPFVTDNSVAYQKDVPSNAVGAVDIQVVGGMTYKDGDTLRSALVTEVKSVGANLLNPDEIRNGYYDISNDGVFVEDKSWKASPIISCSPSTAYTLSNMNLSTAGFWCFYDNNKNQLSYTNMATTLTVTTPSGCSYLTFYGKFDGDVMLNKGSTALPYTPYVEHTLSIPTAVQALDGYGWGVNESVYNYIDWEKKQFVKRVGRVDMGMISWSDTAYPNTFRSGVENLKAPDTAIERANGFIISKYPPSSNVNYTNIDDKSAIRYQTNILVRDSDYADAASFKAAMSGVMLYYELAEPVVTDISNIITSDNLLSIQGNGTLTFENEYGYAVPSTVEYITAEATA